MQDIQPHDSVSQMSHSKHSSVSKCSKSSSISSVKSALGKKMLQNAARKANLIAGESLLARRQCLPYQGMKLNQLREEFQLHEELTKLEAEEKVMDEIFKTDGHITTSIFNTDHSVSLLVKSASHLRSGARFSPPDSVVSHVINQSMQSVARSSCPVSVVSDVINQSMQSVARSSCPVSVVSDVINQSMQSVARSSCPVSVVSDVINQSMQSVARSSCPVSVVSDVINQSMQSVARSSPQVSVVSDVINQSMQSVARSSPQVSVVSGVISQSMRSVDHSLRLLNHPVSEEKQKTSQSARFYGDYDADSLQDQCRQTVGMEDLSSKMVKSHGSTKLVYSYGSDNARRTPSFPDPTAPTFYPSFPAQKPCTPPLSLQDNGFPQQQIYKNSEAEKHIGFSTSGLLDHQFASWQVPAKLPVGSSWIQNQGERTQPLQAPLSSPGPYDPIPFQRPSPFTQPDPTVPQPLMDGKQINDFTTKSSHRAEKQQFSPSVSSVYGNEYLATMKKLADASMLPKSELIHFDGNPLRYYIFMKSFENQVEQDTDDNGRRLQLLIQYCSGKAKKVIESCVLLNREEGYKEAKRLLDERFGSKYKVSNSWINKVSNGPPIKPNDREALMDLADDLQNCEITLRATGRLNQVNNEDKLVRILERCPGYIRARWQSKVQDIREECREPNIEDVHKLVRKVAV